MKQTIFATLLALFGSTAHAADYRDTSVPMQAVSALDVNRYMGRWFEIARFPNRFEKDCINVTAEYTLRDDGKVQVLNSCHKQTSGAFKQAKGVAMVAGPGKLEVSFVPALAFLPFMRADYWVLYISQDYDLAVVGAPGGNLGWILSRTARITDAQLNDAMTVFKNNGYDTSKIERVAQREE